MVLESIGAAGTSTSLKLIYNVKRDKLYAEEDGVKFCVNLYNTKSDCY